MKPVTAPTCPIAKIDPNSSKILAYIRSKLKKKYGKDKPLRVFHAKTIGLLQAELEVDAGLEDFLKVGLFKEQRCYKAWVRFSNSQSTLSADKKRAARGMAIKVLNVPAADGVQQTQDIVLFTGRTFFPGTTQLQADGVKFILGNFIVKVVSLLKVILKSVKGLLTFFKAGIVTPDVVEEGYYSATPYAFGQNKSIKWHARSLKLVTREMPERPEDNFLRNTLIEDLSEDAEEDVAFGLFVQFQENEETEPIDNSAVEWKTPFYRVATIKIPRQHFDTPERDRWGEDISFSPGHYIAEHAPLGGVNRIRANLYGILAGERRTHSTGS